MRSFTGGRLIVDNMLHLSLLPYQAFGDVGDTRVNTLWFVSLIINHMTAFLGLLVKQWLNEHLATEDIATLRRIRIRLRRSLKLRIQAWMIFTIAELIPILLAISFGLLFIGLCFFTSSVYT